MLERLGQNLGPVFLAAYVAAGCTGAETENPGDFEALKSVTVAEAYFVDMGHLALEYGGLPDELTIELVPEEIPEQSPEVAERVRRAVVQIERGNQLLGGQRGSGFLLAAGDRVQLITAGHVVSGEADEIFRRTITVVTDNRQPVDVTRFEAYFHDAPNTWQGDEDFAVGTLENPEAFQERALSARDLIAEPLIEGEQLYLTNFQGGHEPGNPAHYTMIYAGEVTGGDGQLIQVIGDVMPEHEEDDLRHGGSGSVVTDQQGRAVGIGINGSGDREEGFQSYACDEEIVVRGDLEQEPSTIFLRVPAANDECPVTIGMLRTIDNVGTDDPFVTRNAEALQVIEND